MENVEVWWGYQQNEQKLLNKGYCSLSHNLCELGTHWCGSGSCVFHKLGLLSHANTQMGMDPLVSSLICCW